MRIKIKYIHRLMFLGMVSMLCLLFSLAAAESVSVSVADVKGNKPAIYTLISDDGYYDSGVILNELAKKHDLRVTVAGYSRRLNVNYAEWQAIESQGHVEVVSHSFNHRKMADTEIISDDEYYQEIYGSRLFTEEMFGKPMFAFVAPNNQMTERGYMFLRGAGYFAVRRGERGLNPLSPADGYAPFEWFNLGCYGIGDVSSTSERNHWIDNAIESKAWLIEMWHCISPEADSTYQSISTAMADEHLAYAAGQRKQGNLWVASYEDAVRYIRERQNAAVQVVETTRDSAVIELSCDRSFLPQSIFSDPLTLNVTLPEDWAYIFVFQNGRACEVTPLDEAHRVFSFDAVPDGGLIEIQALTSIPAA